MFISFCTLVTFLPLIVVIGGADDVPEHTVSCSNSCRVSLVESIPQNLTFDPSSPHLPSVYSAWETLIAGAKSTLDIASFYWTLQGKDIGFSDTSDWQGERVLEQLAEASRRIKVRVVQNSAITNDTLLLQKHGALVRRLDMSKFFRAHGVLHTKLWVVDGAHVFVGSANMDWRSLTQVKELGVVVYDCLYLVEDIQKLFDVYWLLSDLGTIPEPWPTQLHTNISLTKPLSLTLSGTPAHVYLSSSPQEFCPPVRTPDLTALVDVINKAEKFVHIEVMDYFPMIIYTYPKKFWPAIDDALRRAALDRHVEVRLLVGHWKHTDPDMFYYLRSLAALDGAMRGATSLQVRQFDVPSFTHQQSSIPFARVNHDKFMVTDNAAYIGTSNWSGDYFLSTGGVAMIVNQTEAIHSLNVTDTVQQQLEAVFARDWSSVYSHPLPT